jgi:uncharacterized protein
MLPTLLRLYDNIVLKNPLATILVTLLITAFFAYHTPQFRLDASADSLILENDQALKYHRSISARYGSDEMMVITYTPNADLFSDQILDDIRLLRDELKQLDRVESVVSILDVPLTQSPPVSLSELSDGIRTLDTKGMDREIAKKEFLNSPLYRQLIISPDAKTTAVQVNLKRDDKYQILLKQRNELREKQLISDLSDSELDLLNSVSKKFKDHSHVLQDKDKQLIIEIRALISKRQSIAKMHLGGVPMISSDSVDYIRNDLQTFGIGAIVFIIFILSVSFKKPRWVIFPMISCVLSGIIMVGLLSFLEWRVTVVSSNFISLLLIITLSLCIHIIVRYRELHALSPEQDQYTLVKDAIHSKFLPSFYTTITTMVAFMSLVVSGIRPVIDFGWMMVIGIGIAFALTFTFFPATLLLMKAGKATVLVDFTGKITSNMAAFIHKYKTATFAICIAFAIISFIGISLITVENRFIDYYKEHTEIYQGMELIDKELGGTIPLDIIIDAPKSFFEEDTEEFIGDDEDDLGFELELDDDSEAGISATSYWFNYNMMEQISEIHKYLDGLSETGKVLSIYTTVSMLEQLRDNDDLNDFFLSIIYKRVPENIKSSLMNPYMTEDGNQIRYTIRVYDSDKNLRRNDLINNINDHLINKVGLEEKQVHLTGMLVLYNNMLQSLFNSQILTIGVVFLAILAMFAVLFKSIPVAMLAIIPNMLAASMVLGLMGLSGIPLDIMTITIAAICIGIAVDDTIHYVHRLEEEFAIDRNYWAAIKRSHVSIGRAMYYTTITITLGFSILALSNFMPMIYFGLLTGFAMLVALLANMTLLPLLIALFKPLGKEA